MRRFFSMLVLAAVAAACGNVQPKDIVLTFDVADMTADEIVLVYHNEIRSLTLDGQGHGELVLDDMDAVYARLFYAADLKSFKQIYLEAGDQALVDGFLVHQDYLEMDESLLTGESRTVRKSDGDRIYSGSFCIAGDGYFQVDAFGDDSFASQMLSSAKKHVVKKTPLQMECQTII